MHQIYRTWEAEVDMCKDDVLSNFAIDLKFVKY